MATSAVPSLIDALRTAADTALEITVHDGFGVTDDPGDYLMIGVEDPDIEGAAFSSETSQSWANANHTARDESGSITCAALSWNGDGNQKAARDAAYATTAAVEGLLRTNPSLGVAQVLWTSFGETSQLSQATDEHGAMAMVVFRVTFRARL